MTADATSILAIPAGNSSLHCVNRSVPPSMTGAGSPSAPCAGPAGDFLIDGERQSGFIQQPVEEVLRAAIRVPSLPRYRVQIVCVKTQATCLVSEL